MAETPLKRLREESGSNSSPEFDDSSANSKRQKPYNTILNLLDEEEEEPEPSHELSEDLSAIFTTLEQELTSSTTFDFESLPAVEAAELPHRQSAVCGGDDEDECVKSVMRHLLEASDDELGIPNTKDENNVEGLNYGDNFPFGFEDNGLWEIEDEAANYYTVLQSELFM